MLSKLHSPLSKLHSQLSKLHSQLSKLHSPKGGVPMTNPAMIPTPPLEAGLPCFVNRELSWLAFNRRVLEEAEDAANPLGERLNFAAIFQSNLDEFFMVRVGALCHRLGSTRRDNKTGLTAREQLERVTEQVRADLRRRDRAYFALMGLLNQEGLRIVPLSEATEEQLAALEGRFRREIAPLLAPQVVSPRQSFPFLAGKTAVAVLEKPQGAQRLGLVPCTSAELEPLLRLEGGKFVLTERLIAHFLPRLFPGYQVKRRALVRLVRSADLDLDEALEGGDERYRTAMEALLRTRQRLQPVRLDWQGDEDAALLLCRALKLPRAQCFPCAAPLDLGVLLRLRRSLKPSLFYAPRMPRPPRGVDPDLPLLEQLRQRDLLLSYPCESMEPFLRLLREAGRTPSVRSIAITLYRVAENSQVVDALCQAALHGVDVTAVVELRSRFDEARNIAVSRTLERAGCRVVHGMRGIKIHAKLCLITGERNGVPFCYTQFGTGNYNEQTARLYTDLSLMSANQALGQETARVFEHLTRGELPEPCKALLVAPRGLRTGLLALMDEEIARARTGKPAYIGIKCNAVTDRVLMDKLVEASRAGVRIELLVRGICCLVAGVPGYTENVTVVSIVGRYLEHSRLYLFGQGEGQRTYIASADLMSRSTTRRVESAAPVLDSALERRVRELFRTMMADNVKGRVQQPDGSYRHRRPNGEKPLNAQELW